MLKVEINITWIISIFTSSIMFVNKISAISFIIWSVTQRLSLFRGSQEISKWRVLGFSDNWSFPHVIWQFVITFSCTINIPASTCSIENKTGIKKKFQSNVLMEKIPSFEHGAETVLIKFNTTIKGTRYCRSHFNKEVLDQFCTNTYDIF